MSNYKINAYIILLSFLFVFVISSERIGLVIGFFMGILFTVVAFIGALNDKEVMKGKRSKS